MANADKTTKRADRTTRRSAPTVVASRQTKPITNRGNDTFDEMIHLREVILGLAVADPELLVDAILESVSKDVNARRALRKTLDQRSPTKRMPDGRSHIQATDKQIALVRSRRRTIQASIPISYRKPFTYKGKSIDLTVAKGDEAILLGGVIVSLRGVAAIIPEKDQDKALDEISELLAQAYGGPVTRRALTVRPSTSQSGVVYTGKSRPSESTRTSPQDTPYQIVLAIQGGWDGAAAIIRQPEESGLHYAVRLLQATREMAASCPEAAEAVALVEQEFPETKSWKV